MKLDPTVDALLAKKKHRLMPQVQALRALIVGIDSRVREELKWNSPSFRLTDHFATINLSTADRLRLILHLGAKPSGHELREKVADPAGLLEWLGPERAMVTISDAAELSAKQKRLRAVLRAWVRYCGASLKRATES